MKKTKILLIADRNPYIRRFLQREMSQVGYSVGSAANGMQVLDWIESGRPLDLLILDPELPDTDGVLLFEQLHYYAPNLPIVVHSFYTGAEHYERVPQITACVEKTGASVEKLKEIVADFFRNHTLPSGTLV